MIKNLLLSLLLASSSFACASAWAAPANVNFTVTMSEAVNVNTGSGTPRIAVNVDGQTRYATYSAGTGTSSLTFSYAPTIGDLDLDGVALTSPMDLNGGIITDLNGNPETDLTFTAPNTSGIKIDYPSLSMDFIADTDGRYTLNGTAYNNLSSFLTAAGGTYTRASVGTYFDSTGTLQTASTNTPRFEYDPTTHAPKGILIEESRTNLIKSSEILESGNWVNENSSLTITTNVIAAQDGTLTADKISDNALNIRHALLAASLTITSGTTYTATFFAKSAEHQYIQALFGNAAFPPNAYANFNLSGAGSVSYTGANISDAKITQLNNGWYRCQLTATAITTGTNYHLFFTLTNNVNTPTRSPTYIGSGGGLYIWGAQLEEGTFPTSYIPTTSSQVTRNADSLSLPVGAWFNSTAQTLAGEYSSFAPSTYSTRLASINGGFSANTYQIANASTGKVLAQKAVSGVISNANGPNYIPNTTYKTAGAMDATSSPFAVNNVLYNYTHAGIPSGITRIQIGYQNAASFLNGYISEIKYYPIRTSNSQLQLLTQ